MITGVDIENFKPFGMRQAVPIGPLTLVYGPNSGGKSSLIQALLLMRQSMGEDFLPEHPLTPRGEFVDLGSFKSLLHKHELNRTLRIGVRFDTRGLNFKRRSPVRARPSLDHVERFVATSFAVPEKALEAERPRMTSVEYRLDEGKNDRSADSERLELTLKPGILPPSAQDAYPADTTLLYEWGSEESVHSYATYLFRGIFAREGFESLWATRSLQTVFEAVAQQTSRPGKNKRPSLSMVHEALKNFALLGRSGLPTLLCPLRTPAEQKRDLRIFMAPAPGLDSLEHDYRSVLRSVSYLGPLRTPPERHYHLGSAHYDSVGRRGENTPQMLYYRSDQVIRALNLWFENFDLPYKVDLKKIGDEVVGEMIVIRLKDSRTHTEVTPSDVGFGVGQLLPVIVQGLVSKGQILCVEQPEIHLHPRLQATLGDFFLNSAGIASDESAGLELPRNQWIIETHSEILLLRILRRIREKRLSPDAVKVLYVNPIDDFGSEVLHLRIDDTGNFIDSWPHGFFDETYSEVFA